MQVKLFSASSMNFVEDAVNIFLKEIEKEGSTIVDIKMSNTHETCDIIVIYKS